MIKDQHERDLGDMLPKVTLLVLESWLVCVLPIALALSAWDLEHGQTKDAI